MSIRVGLRPMARPPMGAPAPWLEGYGYRKSHEIDGTTVGAQTDYQVKVVVHRTTGTDADDDVYVGTNCLATFADIRFTAADALTLLDHWLEGIVGDVATFWVEVASIPISPGSATIYIYYGDADAVSASDGDDTFIIWDNCDSITDWSVHYSTGAPTWGTATIDGVSTIYLETNVNAERLRLQYDTKTTTGRENRRFLARIKHTNWQGDSYFHLFFGHDGTSYDRIYYMTYYDWSRVHASVEGVTDYSQIIEAHPSGWYVYEGTINSAGKVTGYRNTTTIGDATMDGDYSGAKVMFYASQFQAGTCKFYVDWFARGKYADPEPSHGAWGSEESA